MFKKAFVKSIYVSTAFFLLIMFIECGNPTKKGVSEAQKFISNLDKNQIKPGQETGKVLSYLFDNGINQSFSMKRGEGDLRLHSYAFSDNSKIIIVSKPKSKVGQGLELVEVKIED